MSAKSYYPPLNEPPAEPVALGSGSIKFAINVMLPPNAGLANAPYLTVNGNTAIGFEVGPKYSKTAPQLAVRKKVAIGYNFVDHTYPDDGPDLGVSGNVAIGLWKTDANNEPLTSVFPDQYPDKMPQLAVGGKVTIGFSSFPKKGDTYPDPTKAKAPELSVNGHVAIGEKINYFIGANSPRLSVRSALSEPALSVTGSTKLTGILQVTQNATFNDRIYFFPDNPPPNPSFTSGAPGTSLPSGVFIDPTPKMTWEPQRKEVQVRYPVLTVVNGLMGQIELRRSVKGTPQEKLAEEISNGINDAGSIDGHYIVMGDLRGILCGTYPKMHPDHFGAYGIRINWDDDFAMLNLLEGKRENIKKGNAHEKEAARLKRPKKIVRDTVLAWGGATSENLLRIRHIGKMHREKEKPVRGSIAKAQSKLRKELPPSRKRENLEYNGKDGGTPYRDIIVVDPDGSVVVNGPLYAMNISKRSDARLKEAIEPIDDVMAKVMALRGVTFEWREGVNDQQTGREYGMIAQEVKKRCPEAVSADRDKLLSIDYDQITPLLLEAVKTQQRTIEEQNVRLDRLEQELREARKEPAAKRPKGRS